MNEDIILSMVKPYVKDDAITYDEFDNIFSILSRKEQYVVSELLFKNGINLVDTHVEDYSLVLDVADEEDSAEDHNSDDFEILYDDALFKDKGARDDSREELIVHKKIHQSNEILCSLIQQGNRQALQDICVKNSGLVDKYAAVYEKHCGYRLDFADLEQVGFMGLIKAAQKFDVNQGFSFSTYAVYWIKQSIAREIMDHGHIIRIPVHMMERINRVAAINNRLIDENTTALARIKCISDEIGIDEDEVIECIVLKNNFLSHTSLDTPVGDDLDSMLGDFIPIEEEITVEEIVAGKALRQELERVLSALPHREQEIIKFRYGWYDSKPRTLEEIGNLFGITRERVRQLESKALRRLRKNKITQQLIDFWEE